jgi:glycosyltransferase involved in cell wall biosynthesis
MVNSNLIFITNGYPFNKGENFIELELKYTAKVFDRVHILAVNNNHLNQRKVPSNTTIHKVKASLSRIKKIRLFFKALLQINLIVYLYKFEINEVKKYFQGDISREIRKQVLHDIFISFQKYLLLERLIKDYSINLSNTIFYSYWINSNATAISILKMKRPNTKVICRAHGSDIYFEASKTGYHTFRLFSISHLNNIFSVSQKGIDYHNNKYNRRFLNMNVAYLGTENLLENHKLIEESSFVIVSVSNVIPLKRVKEIPLVLSKIDGVGIKWIHFGNGTHFHELEYLSKQYLSIKSNINYELKGFVDNDKILKYYTNNKIDLFISLSSSEGIPVSMMEAMSFSIPCLSTNVGGVSELVKDNFNGFLVNPELNITEIENAIIKYFTMSKSMKNSFRENAFYHWKKHFNAKTNFSKFAQDLKQLL